MKKLFLLTVIAINALLPPVIGQNLNFTPQQVEISDTVLTNSILNYQKKISNKDIIIVSCQVQADSVKYYISSMTSSYKLYNNIPSAYSIVKKRYILLYSGLEHLVKISDTDKKKFVSLFKGRLQEDILNDGKTRDPKSIGFYDPFEVLIIVKDGKKVYENSKKGFGAIGGMPYITNR